MKFSLNPYVILAVAAVMAVLVYWPGMQGNFILDDRTQIKENPYFQDLTVNGPQLRRAIFTSDSGPTGRPVAMATFAVNAVLTGLEPFYFKLTNLLLHLLNGLLAFLLVSRILSLMGKANAKKSSLDANQLAAIVALVWMLHPIHVSTVVYVVQRMTVLAALFSMAAMLCYLHGRERLEAGRGGYRVFFAAFAGFLLLGIFSKESAALVPVFLLLVEAVVFGFRSRHRPWQTAIRGSYGLLIAAIVVSLAWALWFTPQWIQDDYLGRTYSMGERLLTQARALWYYLRMILLLPIDEFGLFHDDFIVSRGLLDPVSTLFALLGLAGLVAGAAYSWKRQRVLSLGLGFFLAGHLLESTVLPLELVFEHRNYLASLGIILVLMYVLFLAGGIFKQPRSGLTVTVVFVSLMSGITWVKAGDWSNIVDFAVTEHRNHPRSPRANQTLAAAYFLLAQRFPEREGQFIDRARQTLLNASGLAPENTSIYFTLVSAAYCYDRGALPEHFEELERRIRHQPLQPTTVIWLDSLVTDDSQVRCGMPAEKLERLLRAGYENDRKSAINAAKLYAIMAKFYTEEYRDFESTIYLLALAKNALPGEPSYPLFLARALHHVGRDDDAMQELKTAERLDALNLHGDEIEKLRSRIISQGGAQNE